MILRTLGGENTSEGGIHTLFGLLRAVVCDELNQPLILIAHLGGLGSEVIVVHRGEKGFDDMIKLIPGLSPAKTVDIPFSLNKKAS